MRFSNSSFFWHKMKLFWIDLIFAIFWVSFIFFFFFCFSFLFSLSFRFHKMDEEYRNLGIDPSLSDPGFPFSFQKKRTLPFSLFLKPKKSFDFLFLFFFLNSFFRKLERKKFFCILLYKKNSPLFSETKKSFDFFVSFYFSELIFQDSVFGKLEKKC